MNLLVDGDILVYRCGFAVEELFYVVYPVDETYQGNPIAEYKTKTSIPEVYLSDSYMIFKEVEVEPFSHASHVVDSVLSSIEEEIALYFKEDITTTIYLSGKLNFRDHLSPRAKYKGNRAKASKPVYYQEIRQYLIDRHNAIVVDGMEADDALAIDLTKSPDKSIIASIDKDLLQVSGYHYNIIHKTIDYTKEEEGLKIFYKQILTGDTADNIIGIKGLGPAKAKKLIDPLNTEEEMWSCCLNEYDKAGREPWECLVNAHLLWMLRSEKGGGFVVPLPTQE